MLELLSGIAGNSWGIIAGLFAAAIAAISIFVGVRQGGADAQKVKDQEIQNEQAIDVADKINDAHNAGERTDSDLRADPGKLREDDGYKRGPKRDSTKPL